MTKTEMILPPAMPIPTTTYADLPDECKFETRTIRERIGMSYEEQRDYEGRQRILDSILKLDEVLMPCGLVGHPVLRAALAAGVDLDRMIDRLDTLHRYLKDFKTMEAERTLNI